MTRFVLPDDVRTGSCAASAAPEAVEDVLDVTMAAAAAEPAIFSAARRLTGVRSCAMFGTSFFWSVGCG
jgi:hypothetical protein